MRRSVGYVADGPETWAKAMDDVVIALMIEKTGAMDNLEKNPFRTGAWIWCSSAPRDYSISYGKPRRQDHGDDGHTEADDRNGAEERRGAQGGSRFFRTGEAVHRYGCETFLHRLGRQHYLRLCNQNSEGMAKLLPGLGAAKATERRRLYRPQISFDFRNCELQIAGSGIKTLPAIF